MPYKFFVQQAWPTSAMHVNIGLYQFFWACTTSAMYINVGLSQFCNASHFFCSTGLTHFCNALQFFCSPGLTHCCNVYTCRPTPVLQCSSQSQFCNVYPTLTWPSFAYISRCWLVPLLQANVHVGWTTFARVCDWTICLRSPNLPPAVTHQICLVPWT